MGREVPPSVVEITGDVDGSRISFGPSDWLSFGPVAVTGVDFSASRIAHFISSGTLFERCDFTNARFESGFFGIGLTPSVYRACTFRKADLRRMDLGLSRFERCEFERTRIHDWAGDAAEFVGCRFATRISRSRFAGRPWGGAWAERLAGTRSRNEFEGNDFSESELVDVSFVYGIPIARQKWPADAERYVRLDRYQERVRRAHAVISAWPDDEVRSEALLLLKVYSRNGFDEQEELFADRTAIGDSPGVLAAWHLLADAL